MRRQQLLGNKVGVSALVSEKWPFSRLAKAKNDAQRTDSSEALAFGMGEMVCRLNQDSFTKPGIND